MFVEKTRVFMERHWLAVVFGGLTLAILLVFGSSLSFPLTGFDDEHYVSLNEFVTSANPAWSTLWTRLFLGEFIPATSIVNRFLYQAGDGSLVWFRMAGILFHIANTGLLLVLLARGIGPIGALLGSAFFAIHPIQTESLVWIAARKDLQATFFLLLCLLTYRRSRFLSLSCAALAILSKGSMVILPAFLVLLDGKVRRRQVPFFIVAALGFALTFYVVTKSGNIIAAPDTALWERLAGTWKLVSQIYLRNLFLPYHLSPIYDEPLQWQGIRVFHLLTAMLLIAFWYVFRRKQRRWLIFAAVPFLPYTNLFQTGIVAQDHYFYLSTSLLGLLLAEAYSYLHSGIARRTFWIGMALLFLALSGLTREQVATWRNPGFLWYRTLGRYPNSAVALFMVGSQKQGRGDSAGAEEMFTRLLTVKPDHFQGRFNLATLSIQKKDWDRARSLLDSLHRERPEDFQVLYYQGVVALESGRPDLAREKLLTTLRWAPRFRSAWSYLGLAELQLGHMDQAQEAWQKLLRDDPDHLPTLRNVALLNAKLGRREEARLYAERYIQLCPNCPEAKALESLARPIATIPPRR